MNLTRAQCLPDLRQLVSASDLRNENTRGVGSLCSSAVNSSANLRCMGCAQHELEKRPLQVTHRNMDGVRSEHYLSGMGINLESFECFGKNALLAKCALANVHDALPETQKGQLNVIIEALRSNNGVNTNNFWQTLQKVYATSQQEINKHIVDQTTQQAVNVWCTHTGRSSDEAVKNAFNTEQYNSVVTTLVESSNQLLGKVHVNNIPLLFSTLLNNRSAIFHTLRTASDNSADAPPQNLPQQPQPAVVPASHLPSTGVAGPHVFNISATGGTGGTATATANLDTDALRKIVSDAVEQKFALFANLIENVRNNLPSVPAVSEQRKPLQVNVAEQQTVDITESVDDLQPHPSPVSVAVSEQREHLHVQAPVQQADIHDVSVPVPPSVFLQPDGVSPAKVSHSSDSNGQNSPDVTTQARQSDLLFDKDFEEQLKNMRAKLKKNIDHDLASRLSKDAEKANVGVFNTAQKAKRVITSEAGALTRDASDAYVQ
ncbi:hypothetical protein [Enterobacter sp. 22466]|uniref:hypothetical protein n=1 Tax=Enterobacter sp. 22466 TaxID=3453924 RepID=UPI003F84FE4B